MPCVQRLLTAATLAAGLAACGDDNVRPDLPDAGQVVRPEVVIVERRVYVPVPSELTRPVPIAEGPISQCFSVAAARKKAAEVANARLAEIAAIEGTEVEP